MKRIFFILAIFAIATANAQEKAPQKEKPKTEAATTTNKTQATPADTTAQPPQFAIFGSFQDFEALLATLDNPDAPHRDVQMIKKWIVSQINYQAQQLNAKAKTTAKPDAKATKPKAD
jgi:hypothetical protein